MIFWDRTLNCGRTYVHIYLGNAHNTYDSDNFRNLHYSSSLKDSFILEGLKCLQSNLVRFQIKIEPFCKIMKVMILNNFMHD